MVFRNIELFMLVNFFLVGLRGTTALPDCRSGLSVVFYHMWDVNRGTAYAHNK